MLRSMLRSLRRGAADLAPNAHPFNWLVGLRGFVRGHRRLPRRPGARDATLNDFIFDRMTRNHWSLYQQLCVDKQHAKHLFSGIPGLKVAKLVSVLPLDARTSFAEFSAWVRPHLGESLVMKPSHSSGRVLFLERGISRDVLEDFLVFSKKSHFLGYRETQYAKLERKIIIEENIAPGQVPNDYKFYCAGGRALNVQVDLDRFTNHQSLIMTLPGFERIPCRSDPPGAAARLDRPAALEKMIALAERIAERFDFVRVDLYDVAGEVYFGECTFTPSAARHDVYNEPWAIEVLRRIRAAAESRAHMPEPLLPLAPSATHPDSRIRLGGEG